MTSSRVHLPRPTDRSFKNEMMLAIARRAFVHLPEPRHDWQTSVISLDDRDGSTSAHDLRDGQEVEIVAWRPRSPHGLVYHIRRLSDGREWWVKAPYLRKSLSAPRRSTRG